MTKQKSQEPETQNEVTENLLDQTELEGITETTEPTVIEEPQSAVVENEPEKVPESTPKKSKIEINTVATAVVKGNKKMGVYKFLMLYPQDIYIETLLKMLYPNSFFTKEEWFQRIQEILNMPV